MLMIIFIFHKTLTPKKRIDTLYSTGLVTTYSSQLKQHVYGLLLDLYCKTSLG